jgi:hypothetical protein
MTLSCEKHAHPFGLALHRIRIALRFSFTGAGSPAPMLNSTGT